MTSGTLDAGGLLVPLAIALGLGLLIGIEREWVHKRIAGVRTFPLVAIFGGLAAAMAEISSNWLIGIGLLSCAAVLAARNSMHARVKDSNGSGVTTEFALLLTYLIGARVVAGHWVESMICTGIILLLLRGKSKLHRWIADIDADELREISRLVLFALVILPLLPNREMGYLGVLNPFKIWLMLVLILGISLLAYLASRMLRGSKGVILSGILGGLISSTATTASMARRCKACTDIAPICALISLIASTTVFLRVMIEIQIAAGPAGHSMLLPVGILLGCSVLATGLIARWIRIRHWEPFAKRKTPIDVEAGPPSELRAALVFVFLYVGVILATAYAKEQFGDTGLCWVAALSGLTDMDAITLSTSKLVATEHLDAGIGWRLIVLGGMANLGFKLLIVACLAPHGMLRPLLVGFGATTACALALWRFWPG